MADPNGWQLALLSMLAAFLSGYLLGSIPFGLLITRAAGLGDVRKIGSGNIGATNVLRTGRKGLAALTLLLDALKGTVAMLITAMISPQTALLAGFGAFLGHLFPVWLGFKGGKGVATYLGILLGVALITGAWYGLVIFALTWLLVAFTTRYSSLAALVSVIVVPIALYLLDFRHPALLSLAMSVIVIFKHRANIDRLFAGTESRIGAKG
ncbi:acyl-phosphate glycerol-3-phosphate acyltransferase [Mesorhizobium sp. J18]|uniref:glycerol-3-phosphate 1-O-acyltransferase PlsY n=1 Tax=Mesorhizobium sp. J18 TaxID=935263 RepID=UPI00119A1152|nr:glycerol-3-phosphate 1-O-acyltransferase PlsY [Mesorhizobium sp. J18]TWG99061.1 acyl-phosphate glycerol-3-phosphate acyltransferase [Mesorhizobium sp. J18]